MKRFASAHWEGNLKGGKGTLSTQSGILENTNYSYTSKLEYGIKGTNPEELLAAANAGCFTLAVVDLLNAKGYTSDALNTEATIILNDLGIESMHLKISGSVSNISAEEFATITKDAEQNCFVSKALKIPITSEVHFDFENISNKTIIK
jgi:lipoyl-dependent peroxiredoxin